MYFTTVIVICKVKTPGTCPISSARISPPSLLRNIEVSTEIHLSHIY